ETRKAEQDIRAVQQAIQELETKWNAEVVKTQQDLQNNRVQVIVTGPPTVQAGAPTNYQIETRRTGLGNAPAPAWVKARVFDEKKQKTVYETKLASPGKCDVVLPQDLGLKPGEQLGLEVVAEPKDGGEAKLTEKLPLAAPVYLTHLATDRPMYRPGEVVHFRSLTLERFSLRPVEEELRLQFRVTDPNNAEIFVLNGVSSLGNNDKSLLKGPDGKVVRGVGAGEWIIPPGLRGGEYTLTVSEVNDRFPAERRKFLVNQYQAPRLSKDLEFTRKSYGLGDEV